MPVTVVDHPLAAVRLTALRDERTSQRAFGRDIGELADLLMVEATRTITTVAVDVTTPVGPAVGARMDRAPMLVPILRAGLGMLASAQRLLPDAPVGFLGLRRNEETLQPDTYVSTIPEDLDGRSVIVLDPMLATGGSLVAACDRLVAANAGPITAVCVLVAPEGVEAVDATHPDVRVVTAAVDDHLNDVGFIVPGLGDAGDRQFGVA